MLVCATTVRNGRVLLVRHAGQEKVDYGHWLLPGGKADSGERPEDALRREMKEEVSLPVEIVRKLSEHTDPYTGDTLKNFLCATDASVVNVSQELSEARWFDADEIAGLEHIHPGLKRFLVEGLRAAAFE